MRKRLLVAAAVLVSLGVGLRVFAQDEAMRLLNALEVHRGHILMGVSVEQIWEGATNDTNETTVTVEDPTADRTHTIPNVASDTFAMVGASQTLVGKTLTSPTINTPIVASETMTAAGGTETLTSADCGQTQFLDTASGSVVTLPAATGSGCRFVFLVTVSVTSNAHAIVVVGNDEFVGGLISVGTTADQADAFTAADAADTDTVTMNGTTTGGLLGTYIVVQDISADNWGLSGIVISTDASATMLATAQVS